MKDVLDQIEPDSKIKEDSIKDDADSLKQVDSPIGDLPNDQAQKSEQS